MLLLLLKSVENAALRALFLESTTTVAWCCLFLLENVVVAPMTVIDVAVLEPSGTH